MCVCILCELRELFAVFGFLLANKFRCYSVGAFLGDERTRVPFFFSFFLIDHLKK